MSRQTICFLILGSVVVALILFLITLFTSPIMLLVVILILVLCVGILLQKRPDLFPGRFRFSEARPPEPAETVKRAPFTPHLILVNVDGTTAQEIAVTKPEFTLGRESGCDYIFPASYGEVSRKHLEICYDAERQKSYVIDQGSQNGTFLNGHRLTPERRYAVANGDLLQVASIRFTAQEGHY